MSRDSSLTIGLAVGAGTGPELADAFQQTVERIAQLHTVQTTFHRSPRRYQSYHSLMADADRNRVLSLTRDDAGHYEAYCRQLAHAGVPVVFRTAMNAQALYLVRQRLWAVKLEEMLGDGLDLLLVRDQAQGFYTGENEHDLHNNVVVRTCTFSQLLTATIVDFALKEARRRWKNGVINRVVMAYKFHLLDGCFASWIEQCSREHGVPIELYQPDTANRHLTLHGLTGQVLFIGANEWADIMHVLLLHLLGLGPQENRCTKNVYLHPDVGGLEEYQTVHGSADDLAGHGCVNPFATLRAAAAIMESHAACQGACLSMETALRQALAKGVVTPDLGGEQSTRRVVEFVLDRLTPGCSSSNLKQAA